MSYSTSSGNTLNTALAALAGVVAATVVKLWLDESTEVPVPVASPVAVRNNAARLAARSAKLQGLAEAARDPLYMADMREVNDDFAFVDSQCIVANQRAD